MKTAIEIIGIAILIKKLEKIKLYIGFKLLLEINWTEKIIVLWFY